MSKFIDLAKSEGVIQLGTRIREVQRQMGFLLDNFLFTQEELDLNTHTLLWPHEIGPIFDFNDELAAEVRAKNDSELVDRREKLLAELNKIQTRIEEFTDCGELEMMKEYVQDVKNVQTRILKTEQEIEWIRNVFLIFLFFKIFHSLSKS